jgi:hypothetical protein
MKFKPPKNPLAYLNRLMPRGYTKFFVRRGIGCVIQCSFCGGTPPQFMSGYQKWRWLAGHEAIAHHGNQKPAIPKIGAIHAVEHSRERMVS